MNFKKVSQEVFYTDDPVVNIGLEDIEHLKKYQIIIKENEVEYVLIRKKKIFCMK